VFFQAKQWVFCRKANSWAIIAKIGTAILANEINGWYFLIRNTLRWGNLVNYLDDMGSVDEVRASCEFHGISFLAM
jgi:hypothetical protein